MYKNNKVIIKNNKIIYNKINSNYNSYKKKSILDVFDSKEDFVWENTYQKKEIELTVALPVFKSEKIIWLALESLKNQTDIYFGWELIIWEEYGKSVDIIKEFVGMLPNCQKIVHKSLKNRMLLINKWIGISYNSASTSRIFVLQAADDYSPPKRLVTHYEHFNNPRCYFSMQMKGLFYNLNNGKKIFYLGKDNKKNHLNMAYLIKHMKLVKKTYIKEGVDFYIKKSINNITRNNITKEVLYDDSNNWKYGFFTDGNNIISLSRKKYYDYPTKMFYPFTNALQLKYTSMEDYIPENVLNFLKTFNLKYDIYKNTDHKNSDYKNINYKNIEEDIMDKYILNMEQQLIIRPKIEEDKEKKSNLILKSNKFYLG